MNFYATTVIQRYEKAGALKSEPPQEAPTDFWLDVIQYQKLFARHTVLRHLFEDHFEGMALKWVDEWVFWIFDEIGSIALEDELKPQDEHEYVVQKASHPQFSTFEVYDATDDCVAWGADTTEECYNWINQEKCGECDEWTNDFFRNEDGVVCAYCQGGSDV